MTKERKLYGNGEHEFLEVKNLTKEDWIAHTDRVVKAIERSDLSGLVRKLHQLAPQRLSRMPIALVGDTEKRAIIVCPFVTFRPTHIVLADDSSKAFDLESWTVNNVHMTADGYSMPLETFSIRYMTDDRLAAVNEWTNAPTVHPGMRLTFHISPHKNTPQGAEFRGILWGFTVDY